MTTTTVRLVKADDQKIFSASEHAQRSHARRQEAARQLAAALLHAPALGLAGAEALC